MIASLRLVGYLLADFRESRTMKTRQTKAVRARYPQERGKGISGGVSSIPERARSRKG